MFSCWHSPFSPEWVPDVFFVFFFSFLRPEAQWLGETSRCCTNHQIIHTNWHHLMSRTTFFKEKLHPFKPVQHISQRDAEKKKKTCLPSIYGECKPQRQKWDMCKLLWMHSILCDECSMYNMGREKAEVEYLPIISVQFGLWKGRKIKGTLCRS